ncbi:MAG TPA: hypothetical protein VG388_00185 [Solirubrobacteraceae bacterium]|nr:hypothetical protein [Solirubrobacteraceae bacterium]
MRGGAIPLLAWGALLVLLAAANWIWTGDAIEVGTFSFSVLVVIGAGAVLAIRRREALRRGPPEPRRDAEAVPDVSVGAVLAGVSVGSTLFGLVFGTFFVYAGIFMFLVSLGRLGVEVWTERRTEQAAQERRP